MCVGGLRIPVKWYEWLKTLQGFVPEEGVHELEFL
jgi:hypothetical protein